MHESSIARQLLSAALDRAAAEGATRVLSVLGWVAEAEALSPESLSLHFAAHARGTPAEGARLDLRLLRVEARCLSCGGTYAPDHHVLLCPRCGGDQATLLGRLGLGLDALEVE
ncbi:hydrogenase nickel incorporation protein HypA [Sorangium cellulosum]|uniref:Hydrogenase maturation factor HypA n=1 Tax=Sorangium cellulosum TaxID=56 RepID=A0A150TAQ6_SORCE|nr:hydrogenase nickel incorporation protein HypA [Sorangium cellulosum]